MGIVIENHVFLKIGGMSKHCIRSGLSQYVLEFVHAHEIISSIRKHVNLPRQGLIHYIAVFVRFVVMEIFI